MQFIIYLREILENLSIRCNMSCLGYIFVPRLYNKTSTVFIIVKAG